MAFASGRVSFRRFAVLGKGPKGVEQDLLDKLAEYALKEGEFATPEEIEWGWSGGRHILDGSFSFANNVFADALHFALRIDTNKVPADLKKAYTAMEEEKAGGTSSEAAGKAKKKAAKDAVAGRLEEELRSGRFRRSKLLPILWDLPAQMLYCPAAGTGREKLLELFQRTFGLELLELTSGSAALRLAEAAGKHRDYEDLRPTRFVPGPEGEGQYPDYPWVAKGDEPKDFLGNEFGLWLWHEADHHNGTIATGTNTEVTIMIDKMLDLECAYGESGKDTLRGTGPAQMPEARHALRSGKLPRRMGLTLITGNQQFELGMGVEPLSASGARLPDIEDAETARVIFEERIGLVRDLAKAMDGLFATFFKLRASAAWEGRTGAIQKWILAATKAKERTE